MIHELEMALNYATVMHSGQKRITGEDYIWHPIGVASRCQSWRAKVVALFHDLLEDTAASQQRIFELVGKDQEMMDAILLLTRNKEGTYKEFIQRIKNSGNPLAIEVKIADLQDNLSTVDSLPPEKRTLKIRYLAALVELQGE